MLRPYFVRASANLSGLFGHDHLPQSWKRQTVKTTYNTTGHATVQIPQDEYMSVTVLALVSGDLMVRFADGPFQPYIGAGAGLTMNFINSDYIMSTGNIPPLNDVGLGLLLRAPLGLRCVVSDTLSGFVEYRPTVNYFMFDRSITSDHDTGSLTANFLFFGFGYKFQ
jgi:hypothetical protein